jgi:hypothetical protein
LFDRLALLQTGQRPRSPRPAPERTPQLQPRLQPPEARDTTRTTTSSTPVKRTCTHAQPSLGTQLRTQAPPASSLETEHPPLLQKQQTQQTHTMSSAGRGRGGKFNKVRRGGGKKFSRDLQPLNADGEVVGMWGVSNLLLTILEQGLTVSRRNNPTRSTKSHQRKSPRKKSPATRMATASPHKKR